MIRNLPTELLRTVVAIVETGSMVGACNRVHLTPSAISMQIKRLEEMLQTPIFARIGKRLRPTPAGELVINHARQMLALNDSLLELVTTVDEGPVRIGLIQDVVDSRLADVLAMMAGSLPHQALYVKVAGSSELKRQLSEGLLDLVVCLSSGETDAGGITVPMQWFGSEQLLARPSLPLAVLEKPCAFRSAGLDALEAAQRPFHIILETPSIAGIRAAVEAGLAVTCRTGLAGHLPPYVLGSLPPLPPARFVILTGKASAPRIEPLRAAIARIMTEGQHNARSDRPLRGGTAAKSALAAARGRVA